MIPRECKRLAEVESPIAEAQREIDRIEGEPVEVRAKMLGELGVEV